MKVSDFTQTLRTIIKEEVRSIIREELKTVLTPVLLEYKRSKNQIIQNKQQLPVPKQQPLRDYGKGLPTALGDILRETANDLRSGNSAPIQESVGNDWDDMGHYSADDAVTFGAEALITNDSDGAFNPNDPTTAFIKDYSSVLKSSYEHSGHK